MLKYFAKFRVIVALILVVGLVFVVISACDLGDNPIITPGPSTFGILTPSEGVKVLVQGPVQILSAFQDADNISRVELLVREPNTAADKLLRSDVPDNGLVVQEWVPQQAGMHEVKIKAFTVDNELASKELTRQVEVIDGPAITLIDVVAAREESNQGAALQLPTSTPPPEIITTPQTETQQDDAVVVMVATVASAPTPTPIPHFPPPPPIPGVPPGPTQAELPALTPPVCDAAKYMGPFTANTSRRIMATGDDDIALKTMGGTMVHRAWRLQNIGTCTWGPGYELAFYGGRAMGSGGVAFESTFPTDPGRRNALVDTNRLIVPEGIPNQVAVVEVLLNVPPIPGIHQSYWRMRNPQGVYFGPIMGVTFEVVRECEFGILGAPVINKFEILGVGNVFKPESPTQVLAKYGQTVTLNWDIINTSNFDVVLEDPTGVVSTLSNTDPKGRSQFRVTKLGQYIVTVYADNGPCTVTEFVTIDVVPDDENLFELDVILSPTTAAANVGNAKVSASIELDTGNIIAEWRHFEKEATDFTLTAQGYRIATSEKCFEIFDWKVYCQDQQEWKPTGKAAPISLTGEGGVSNAATVAGIESQLCKGPDMENLGIRYWMQAKKQNGEPASPEYSNKVDTVCGGASSPPSEMFGP